MMKKIAILYFLGALLLSGCVRDEFDTTRVEEGLAAHVGLKMMMPDMGGEHGEGSTRSTADTRAVDDDVENRLDNLRVLIFNSSGELVTNRKYTAQPNGPSLLSLQIDTWSGSNHTFCFVANTKDDMDSRLAAVTSYDALREFMVTASGLDFGLNSTEPLVMTAIQEHVDVQPGTHTITTPVQLQYLAAKLTLTITDATPEGQEVTVIGWDVQDVPVRSYLFEGNADINPDPDTTADDKDEYWLTSTVDYPFETEDKQAKTVSQTLYLFENRRGGRIARALPDDTGKQYPNMNQDDADSRGKAWFKPGRATAVVITAMHTTDVEERRGKAYIYLGEDNHSDYNIRRGHHYTFNIIVRGVDDIKVDTNVDSSVGYFLIDYGSNLTMDAHPDFRPMRMHAANGTAVVEILDSQERTCNEPGFDADWLKISPLNLMYHQVKQSSPGDAWQQAANPESKFVRPKYIPHKSIRTKLEAEGKNGWPAVPSNLDDDDSLPFADATYRMCYRITDIPFADASVIDRTFYVYADEFLQNSGNRTARVRFSFYKNGGDPDKPEIRIFIINQSGYLSFYTDDNHKGAGLNLLNEDGTPSSVKRKMVVERYPEFNMVMNPGIDPSLQNISTMQWGFSFDYVYNSPDKFRNGKFLTANMVYTDVQRTDNEATGFGMASDSYRDMYGSELRNAKIGAYTGTVTGPPYYYPDPAADIYHPIYKSSAGRYCHEKNRDLNGDGIIDESETNWYLPAQQELLLMLIALPQNERNFAGSSFISSTETRPRNFSYAAFGIRQGYPFIFSNTQGKMASVTYTVRCGRELR